MILNRRTKQDPIFKIFSFYNSKVNKKVPRYQRKVFRKFGFRVHQVKDESFSHGDFLNHVCRNVKDTRYLIFFDIDCVPLSRRWFSPLMECLQQPDTIVGAAQTANHLRDGKNLYIGPCFLAISTEYLARLNYPDMNMTEDMDAGQNLTETIRRDGGNICFWWPTHVEEEQWDLYHPPDHKRFGLGTTYNGLVYHAFLSRFDMADRFLIKCRSLMNYRYFLGIRFQWPFDKQA